MSVLRVLCCPWDHVVLWPDDLQPYPDKCVVRVETDALCGRPLTPRRQLQPVDPIQVVRS